MTREEQAAPVSRPLSAEPLGHETSPQAVAALLTSSADITLVLDAAGVILDAAVNAAELILDLGDGADWIGRKLTDTVAPDSIPKAEALLADARSGAARPRHLNHLRPDGRSVPVTYRCARFGDEGRLLAFGRDLRDLAQLQQRLITVQQKFEHDYGRWRDLEARYRLLFQLANDPIMIVEATRLRVVEANPAARALFGVEVGDLAGLGLPQMFAGSVPQVEAHLSAARAGVRVDATSVTIQPRGQEPRAVTIRAFFFRQDNEGFFLLRIALGSQPGSERALPDGKAKLLAVTENAVDAVAVADDDGRLITANVAFLDLVQVGSEDVIRGRTLDEWIGNSTVDINVLLATLRQRGTVRFFQSTVHGQSGSTTHVEISAVAVRHASQLFFGFALRNVEPRPTTEAAAPTRALSRSVEQLTELIGQVPMKDLVREATEVIEKLCIEAALELTGDNRASAAEMLGLSRQSLYVKLRRYGLGDLGGGDDEDEA